MVVVLRDHHGSNYMIVVLQVRFVRDRPTIMPWDRHRCFHPTVTLKGRRRGYRPTVVLQGRRDRDRLLVAPSWSLSSDSYVEEAS
jgi:hypothetical protein